jgi:predicted Ser/Thr protein kinase
VVVIDAYGPEDRFSRIEQIYRQALERPEEERPAFLIRACAHDEDVRHEVEKLLSFDGKAGSSMESPALDMAARALARRAEPGMKINLIGQTILHYKVLEKIGEGGMGIVYRALDTHLQRPVAIKVLPPETVTDRERRLRFVQEARAASALNHPNIVHVYDIEQTECTDFMAMEYVPGKTLAELIPRKGMKLADALKYSIQIADALAAAHAAGIVHRDLKPANVMITEKGQVKILDFGLAKLTELVEKNDSKTTQTREPRTEEGTILGTAAYMSPEQAEGKKVDARSDIFSPGSLFYEMLTGQKAFQGTSRVSTLSAVLYQEPKPASGITSAVPAEVERLINRCLRKDPERRIQYMDDVKLALLEAKEALDAQRLMATRAAAQRASPMRFKPVVVAVLAVFIAVGWYWLRQRRQAGPEAPLTTVPLTSYPGFEYTPSFSPDGNYVAFEWCPDDPGAMFLAVSPDDRTILYSRNDQAGSDLMLVENFR